MVVLHGLNNVPSVMSAISEALLTERFNVLEVTLSGEAENRQRTSEGVRSCWQSSVESAVARAREEGSGATFVFGFSLGALVTLEWLDSCDECTVDGAVLVAPPIKLKWTTKLLRVLFALRADRVVIPSLAPARFRRDRSVSVRTYRAMLEAADSIDFLKRNEKLASLGVTLVLSGGDEVVSARATKSWLDANRLADWRVLTLEAQPEERPGYDHLLVRPEHAGEVAWESLLEETLARFVRESR